MGEDAGGIVCGANRKQKRGERRDTGRQEFQIFNYPRIGRRRWGVAGVMTWTGEGEEVYRSKNKMYKTNRDHMEDKIYRE